jgi:DNA-binding CsgD family transcriptional regulator
MINNIKLFDTSDELMISCYGDGIKLVRSTQSEASSSKKILELSVADLLSLPFNVYFLNYYSEMQRCNKGTAEILNYESTKDLVGKTAFEAFRKEDAFAMVHEDQKTINTKKMNIFEAQITRLDDIDLHCTSLKFPWYSGANQLIGVFGFSIMIGQSANTSIAQALSLIRQTGLLGLPNNSRFSLLPVLSDFQVNKIYLSTREKEILNHLVRGKTAKEIANIIGRSKRTVEHHLENIKLKTGTSSKSELIEKYITLLLI